MPRLARSCLLPLVTLSMLGAPLVPSAQTMQPGETTSKASLTVINQFDADLDAGGKTGWGGIFVSGSASRQVTPQITLGANAGYDYQNWRFSSPAAFGGRGPWDQINFFVVGLDYDYLGPSGLAFGISPSLGWQYESGAKAGDALEWGAVFTLAQVFSKDLTLGIGAGVFNLMEARGRYDVSFFPIVKWQITDKLRVDNPFSAGISGGAGLELAYAFDDRWEIAAGASDRTYAFRLKNSGPNANGIGENRFYPVFARLSYGFAPKSRVTLYAAAVVNGRLTVMNPGGEDLAKDDYKTAPALGLTVSLGF